jgi:hypothetical protein
MGKAIKDEFATLRVSRQWRYQLRMRRDGRCIICGEPAVTGLMCLDHMVKARERQRKRLGLKRRHHNARSYQLEAKRRTVRRRT